MENKVHILVTNDDGYDAPGLLVLLEELNHIGRITVVAPSSEKSAMSHAISIRRELEYTKIDYPVKGVVGYHLNGTPADCVHYALKKIEIEPVDLVISGINRGANTGVNILYSGTVGAAAEGALAGIPSMAVSRSGIETDGFKAAARIARKLSVRLTQLQLPPRTVFNVNVPCELKHNPAPILLTRQANNSYYLSSMKEETKDVLLRTSYFHNGPKALEAPSLMTDEEAVSKGYVSVTPLHFDLTAFFAFQHVSEIIASLEDY